MMIMAVIWLWLASALLLTSLDAHATASYAYRSTLANSTCQKVCTARKEVIAEYANTLRFLTTLIASKSAAVAVNAFTEWHWQIKAAKNSRGGSLVSLETMSAFTDIVFRRDSHDPDLIEDASTKCGFTCFLLGVTLWQNMRRTQATVTSSPLSDATLDAAVVYEHIDSRLRYDLRRFQRPDDGLPRDSRMQAAPSPPRIPVRCFSGQNTVHEQKKGTIPISDLRVGDRVRTKDGKYTRVYSLGHWDPVHEAEFIQLLLSDDTILELSDDHMVFFNGAFAAAKEVRIGDFVSGEFGEAIQVKEIVRTINRGLFAPLTEAGHLLVSGILSSSYVDILELGYGHQITHWILAPVRLYSRVSNSHEETYTNGISNLVNPLVDLSLAIKALSVPAQWFLVAIGATLIAPLNAFV